MILSFNAHSITSGRHAGLAIRHSINLYQTIETSPHHTIWPSSDTPNLRCSKFANTVNEQNGSNTRPALEVEFLILKH